MGRPEEQPTSGRTESKHRHARLWTFVLLGYFVFRYGFKNWCTSDPLDLSLAAPGTYYLAPCEGIKDMQCGHIVVPKDYFDPSAGVAQIALARYKATEHPKKGTIMLNPGGPGGSGKAFLASRFGGELLATMLGHNYDLIGFDPRGIGETKPKVECFLDPQSFRLFVANTVFERSFEVPSQHNISSPDARAALIEQNKQFLSLKEAQAKLCAQNMGDELKYMGSATVVRDMDFMTKIFDGEHSKINYFGGSYGSILGMYLVNMLPDRVGYATVDGIADPVSWSNEPSHKWHKGWISSAEATYKVFLEDCTRAGPDLCKLAKKKDEPIEDIDDRIERFLIELASHPLPVPLGNRPGYLSAGLVRALFLVALERPTNWPAWSAQLAEAMKGHGTALYNSHIPAPGSPDRMASSDLSRLGVTCADSPLPKSKSEFPTPEDLADEMISTMRDVSYRFGAHPHLNEQDGGCQYWPTAGREPERFTGPWNHTLETPLLIMSNTHDPITPIASALLINSLMPNSTLILQEGPGHCTIAMPSLCSLKIRRDYYQGIIPKNGTTCSIDTETFPDPGAEMSAMQALSHEDRELLEAAHQLREVFHSL
jgi:pimeloyl-ACP methyl ester carboxylesterase